MLFDSRLTYKQASGQHSGCGNVHRKHAQATQPPQPQHFLHSAVAATPTQCTRYPALHTRRQPLMSPPATHLLLSHLSLCTCCSAHPMHAAPHTTHTKPGSTYARIPPTPRPPTCLPANHSNQCGAFLPPIPSSPSCPLTPVPQPPPQRQAAHIASQITQRTHRLTFVSAHSWPPARWAKSRSVG